MEENTDWIDEVMPVFERLLESTYSRRDIIPMPGNSGNIRFGSRLLLSIMRTLEEVQSALSQHSESDVHVLSKKIRDDGLFFLMLLDCSKKHNPEPGTLNKSRTPCFLPEDEVEAWFETKLRKAEEIVPDVFRTYFEENEVITTFINTYYEERLGRWNRILNAGVCGNSDNLKTPDNEIQEMIFGLTSFILSVIILIDSSYIAAVDCGECISEMPAPPEDFQNRFDPVFTAYMQKRMSKDEVEYLRKHQKYRMEF